MAVIVQEAGSSNVVGGGVGLRKLDGVAGDVGGEAGAGGAGLCEISWGHDDALVRSLVQKKNRHQCRKKFANNLLKHQHTDTSTTAYIISPHNSYHETFKSYCLFYAFNFLTRISCKR